MIDPILTGLTIYGGTVPDKATQTTTEFANNVYPFHIYYNATFVPELLLYNTALNTFKTQANELADNVNALEESAVNAKVLAESARDSAFLTANVSNWVSGTTYTIGQNVLSLIDFKTYVRKTNGAGTTDPSLDSANYDLKVASDNTKLPLSGGTMTGAITALKETSVAIASDIDLSLGNLYTKSFSGSPVTFTVSNVPTSGTVAYMILELTNAGSVAITWFSGVKWAGGTAPILTSNGKDILSMYTIDAGVTWNVLNIQKDVK